MKEKALQALRPDAEWVLRGDELEWLDTEQTQPTEAEITAKIAELEAANPCVCFVQNATNVSLTQTGGHHLT